MARPSKIKPFVEAAEEVLFEDINAIIYTDQELIDEINERLDEKHQIVKRTFQQWKQKLNEGHELDGMGKRFFTLLKKALRQQKQQLFDEFKNSTQWQKWAWIIERKFDEWNIRHKMQHEGDMKTSMTVEFVDSDTDKTA